MNVHYLTDKDKEIKRLRTALFYKDAENVRLQSRIDDILNSMLGILRPAQEDSVAHGR